MVTHMNILTIGKIIIFIALIILLIVWPFKPKNIATNDDDDVIVLKRELLRTIDSMKSYALKAYTLLDTFNVRCEYKGKTCILMIGVVHLSLCRLMDNCKDQDINKVHYMLAHYYVQMFEPLLKVASNEISEYFDKPCNEYIHTDEQRVDTLIAQWDMILSAISGIEDTFETFDRSHNVKSNSECEDGLIESYRHGFSEIIEEGKLM